MADVDVECQSTSAPATQVPEARSTRHSLLSLSSAEYQDYSSSLHRDNLPKSLLSLRNSESPPGSSNSNSSNKYSSRKKNLLSRAVGTKEPSLEALEQLRQRTFAEAKDATDAAIKLRVSPMKLPPEAPSPTSKEPGPPKKKGGGGKGHADSQGNLSRVQRFGSSDTFGKEVSRSPMLTMRNAQRASSILTQQYSIDENAPFMNSESQATTAIPSSAGSNGVELVSFKDVSGIEEARDSLEYCSSEDSVEFSIRDSFVLTENPLTPRGGTATKVSPINRIAEDDIPGSPTPTQDIEDRVPNAPPPLQEQFSPPDAKNVSPSTALHLEQTTEPDLQHEWKITRNTQEIINQKGKCKKNGFKIGTLRRMFCKKSEVHE